jgi:hypothetical protein
MRRVLLATAAILALGTAFAGTAQAKCSVTCLNRKVKQLSSGLIKAEKTIASLSKTVSQQGQAITAQNQTIAGQGATIAALSQKTTFVTALEECLYEAPFTEYGDPEGSFGYHFNTGTEEIETSALDITEEGDPILAWFVFDACNTQTTLTLNGTSGVLPHAESSSPLFSSEAGRR